MAALRFLKGNIRISRSIWTLFIAMNSMALLVNLFVGLLVYQNPLLALADEQNMMYVLLFGTVVSILIYGGYKLVVYLEKLFPGRRMA